MATNFPLVRITNDTTQDVFYCRTHNFSSMGVAEGSDVTSAEFDVPPSIELGDADLVVVANGIPSPPIQITVTGTPQNVTLAPNPLSFRTGINEPITETTYLTNNGPGTLVISGFSGPGDEYDFFSLSKNTCKTTLPQGQSCALSITFDPQYCIPNGRDDTTLYISDTGVGGGQTLNITGITSSCGKAPTATPPAPAGAAPSPAPATPDGGGR